MARPTNTKRDFERLHLYYQKRAYTLIIREFRKILRSIKFDDLNYNTALATIALNINDSSLEHALRKMYIDTGLRYGKHVLRDIRKEKAKHLKLETKADAPYPLFSEKFINFISNYLRTDGGAKVTSLTNTMTKKVMTVISDAQKKGLTQSAMTEKVRKEVNKANFYRANAMRIVRTESLFAMNSAKVTSFETSNIVVNKIWIQGGSRHPRDEHTQMDGVEVGENEYFELPSGDKMLYPGDQSAPKEQVINCSCTIGYRSVRDSEGNLVFKE